jgi:hypothetical protein
MRRAVFVTGLAGLALPLSVGAAQVTRWNDRAPNEWTQETPRVRLSLEGADGTFRGAFNYGEAVRVRFHVDRDAYVVVGRVDADGRLTILFPTSAGARTFVREGSEVFARGRRAGAFASFYAFDRFGTSYVFALASSAPLDLSQFRVTDFERTGLDSRFTYANRRFARDPDEYVQRFASWVLYDANVDYDYDVAYYAVGSSVSYASSLGLCFSGNRFLYDDNDRYGYGGYGYSLTSACRSYYNSSLWCLGYSLYSSYAGCFGYNPYIVRGPVDPYTPQPPVPNPNKKGSGFGDDWKPETIVDTKEDWRTAPPKEQAGTSRFADGNALRGDGEWDNIKSIPARSLDDLKRSQRDEARIKTAAEGTTRAERRFTDEERAAAIRSPRPASATGAPSREAKAPARDRDNDPPRRFAGSTGTGPSRTADRPPREPVRSAPARSRGSEGSSAPRPASREPSTRSDSPARSAPAASGSGGSIRSEPAKGSGSSSSSGGEKRKPPRE